MTHPIFCPTCQALILDAPKCAACGWLRPRAIGDTGKGIWRAELKHVLPKPRASAVVVGEHYCLSVEDGTIIALDCASGQVAWERQIDAGRAAHALATDGIQLLISSLDTRPIPVGGRALLALAPATGEDIWQYTAHGHSLSAAALAQGMAYVSSSDGVLHAVDLISGQERWQVAHTGWGPEAPAADSAHIYVGGRADTLVAYAADDGAERWRFSAGAWFASPLCLAGSTLYALNWDGFLYALEARTGRLQWKLKGERGQGFTSPPATDSSRLYVGSRVYREQEGVQTNAYALLALRKDDGGEAWRFFTPKQIVAPPAVADDSVLFGAEDGIFYALDAATGVMRWKFQIDGRMVTQPQIADDIVYIGERHGAIYAIRWRAGRDVQLQAPEEYVRRGEPELAATTYALQGEFAIAAKLFAELGHPREAALLYERAEQPALAAQHWETLGELRRARDLYQAAGALADVARMLVALGEPLQAAKIYEEMDAPAAAALYEQAGDRVKAADLYHSAGQVERAAQIWQSLGQWERLAEALISDRNLVDAARLLDQHDQRERAAELYEQAGQLAQALGLRIQLGHWERAADLATRQEDYTQAAQAHERLGNGLRAAELYERSAQQAIAANPTAEAESRAATLYEQAAQLYDTALADEDLARCRHHVKQLRQQPDIVVSGVAQTSFVEFEWNTLNLLVNNMGYGLATQIALTFQGAFDIEGELMITRLAPNKSAPIEMYIRPQRDYFGPKVPLEITVTYQDRAGGQYTLTQRIPLRVLPKGSIAEQQTPLEIDIRSGTQPNQQETTPVRSVDQEEIEQQQSLLRTHRRTHAHLVGQAAQYGGERFAPPQVANGLYEARANIQHVKQVLRAWGIAVADHPNDGAEIG